MAKCPLMNDIMYDVTHDIIWERYEIKKKYIIKTQYGLFSPDVNSDRGSGSACNVVFTPDGFDGVYRESGLSC